MDMFNLEPPVLAAQDDLLALEDFWNDEQGIQFVNPPEGVPLAERTRIFNVMRNFIMNQRHVYHRAGDPMSMENRRLLAASLRDIITNPPDDITPLTIRDYLRPWFETVFGFVEVYDTYGDMIDWLRIAEPFEVFEGLEDIVIANGVIQPVEDVEMEIVMPGPAPPQPVFELPVEDEVEFNTFRQTKNVNQNELYLEDGHFNYSTNFIHWLTAITNRGMVPRMGIVENGTFDYIQNLAPNILQQYTRTDVQEIIRSALQSEEIREEFVQLVRILDIHRCVTALIHFVYWTGVIWSNDRATDMFSTLMNCLKDIEHHFMIWRVSATLPINFSLYDLSIATRSLNMSIIMDQFAPIYSTIRTPNALFTMNDFIGYIMDQAVHSDDQRWAVVRRRIEDTANFDTMMNDRDYAGVMRVLFPEMNNANITDVFAYATLFSQRFATGRETEVYERFSHLGYENRERTLWIGPTRPTLFDLCYTPGLKLNDGRYPFFRDIMLLLPMVNRSLLYDDVIQPWVTNYVNSPTVSALLQETTQVGAAHMNMKQMNLRWFLDGTRCMVTTNMKMNQLIVPILFERTPLDAYLTNTCGSLNIPLYVIRVWLASMVDNENLLRYMQMTVDDMRASRNYQVLSFTLVVAFVTFWRKMNAAITKDTLRSRTFRKVVRQGYKISLYQAFPFLTGCAWMDRTHPANQLTDYNTLQRWDDIIDTRREQEIPQAWIDSCNQLAHELADSIVESVRNHNIPRELSIQITFSRVRRTLNPVNLNDNVPSEEYLRGDIGAGFNDLILDYRTGRNSIYNDILPELRRIGIVSTQNRFTAYSNGRRDEVREYLSEVFRNYLRGFINYLKDDYDFDINEMMAINFKLERLFFTLRFISNPRRDRLTHELVYPPQPQVPIFVDGRWKRKVFWSNPRYKPLFSFGLCLLESFYFIKNQDDESTELTRLQNMMSSLHGISTQLRSALLSGNVDSFVQYDETLTPLYLVSSAMWLTEEPTDDKTLCIIVKNEHAFVNTYKFIRTLNEIDWDKQVFSLRREKVDAKKERNKLDATNDVAWDIEAFVVNKEFIPYCVCLKGRVDGELFERTYYGLDCLTQFIGFLRNCEKNITFWTFNGRKFDHIFVVKRMILELDAKVVGKENDIIAFATTNLRFLDLRQIFSQGSLKYLANLFQTETRKGEIDFNDINQDTFLIERIRTDVIKYCLIDCQVLYELVQKFYSILCQLEYKGIKFVGCPMTTANMALSVYKQLFIPKNITIHGSYREIYEIERESYYGGYVNAFKKYGSNLFYYDINSSYPYSMTGKGVYGIPVSIKERKKFMTVGRLTQVYERMAVLQDGIMNINPDSLYLCKWRWKKELVTPFFALRTNEGLIYPTETKVKDWRWGELIKLGLKYNLFEFLEIYEEIEYNIQKGVFTDYVNYFYSMKAETKRSGNKTMNYFYKLLLNSLYGKFGQRQFDEQFFCSLSRTTEFIRNEFCSIKLIDDDLVKVSIAKQKGVEGLFSCVRIASRITASSLATLAEAMFSLDPDPIESSKRVWYVDTDSIVCDRLLPPNMCDEEILGKFKKEYNIQEAWFVSAKNYLLKYDLDGELKVELKMKGVSSDNFKTDPGRFFSEFLTHGETKVVNKNVFKRKFNGVDLIDIEKTVKVGTKRRLFENQSNDSKPHQNIIDYYLKFKPNGIHLKREQDKWREEEEN